MEPNYTHIFSSFMSSKRAILPKKKDEKKLRDVGETEILCLFFHFLPSLVTTLSWNTSGDLFHVAVHAFYGSAASLWARQIKRTYGTLPNRHRAPRMNESAVYTENGSVIISVSRRIVTLLCAWETPRWRVDSAKVTAKTLEGVCGRYLLLRIMTRKNATTEG